MSSDREEPLPLEDDEQHVESAILGFLLRDDGLLARAASVLNPEDFQQPSHRMAFKALVDISEDEGGRCDVVMLAERLRSTKSLDSVGGLSSLSRWIDEATPGVSFDALVASQLTAAERRRAAHALHQGLQALREGASAREAVESSEAALADALTAWSRQGLSNASEAASELVDELLSTDDDKDTTVCTGIRKLDLAMEGLRPGDLCYVAARPGEGKSTLMLETALHATRWQGKTVAMFSLEMPNDQQVRRILSNMCGIDAHRLRDPRRVTPIEWRLVVRALIELGELPLFIDDSANLTVSALRARAKRLKEERGLDLICVDYVQLLRSGRRREDEYQEIGMVSNALKEIARDLAVPVLALCQMNRNVEGRSDRLPMLSDLRGHGSLEQDADQVIFLHARDDGKLDLILAKNRHGPPVTARAAFLRHCYAILN